MADVTGTPVPTGASEFNVPGDMKEIADHFGGSGMFSRPTVSALPASGNWPGRMLMAEDTGAVYMWSGSGWFGVASPASALGTSVVPTPAANYTLSSNSLYVRSGFLLGSITFARTSGTLTHGEQIMTLPAGAAPSHEYNVDALLTLAGNPSVLAPLRLQTGGVVQVVSPPANRTGGTVSFVVPIPF